MAYKFLKNYPISVAHFKDVATLGLLTGVTKSMSVPACSGRQRCELKKGCLEAGNKYKQMKAAEQSIRKVISTHENPIIQMQVMVTSLSIG